jgi:prepilin-type processing-associated H-X9-DG protein
MTTNESKTKQSWILKIVLVAGILILVAPVLYVGLVMMALKAHLKDDCGTQLRISIGVRLREYAAKHEGRFPNKWSELEWDDMGGITNTTWPRVFICPTVGHGPGDWNRVDLWCDYILIPGCTTNDSNQKVLAIEPLANHKTGVNVLFADGSSAWWPADYLLSQQQASTNVSQKFPH